MKSLSARLTLAVSALLLVFFGVAIFALESAFRDSSEQAIRDRLDVQMLMLISASDTDDSGRLQLPEQLPEARFMSPGSGLYGQVIGEKEELIWRSLSAVGLYLPIHPVREPGDSHFQRAAMSDGTEVFSYNLAVEWELSTGEILIYTFSVAESLAPFVAQVKKFRRRLITLFGALMAVLLASQALVLRWVLQPLRQVEQEIDEIESGERTGLSSRYPSELQGLTYSTNSLIHAERNRLSRYRNTLGNLAHSLKTPLAIVRNTLEKHTLEPSVEKTIHEQVNRMNDIVGYQLQRAAASGSTTLGQRKIEVNELIDAIINSLHKVYAAKNIACRFSPTDIVEYRAEKGDLMELFGNLLDNAFKWSRHTVEVSLEPYSVENLRAQGLQFSVSDDGPGIPPEDVGRVLRRGQRADESVAGHGIGLSVVGELVELLDGTITIEESAIGGARINVKLPPR